VLFRSCSENAFIRPSPSAGSLGGVARKTRETIVLCEAAGFDTIMLETVGVGQSEIAAHSMVDFFLLIQLANTGDELQGIKRGIMEMADGIAINKSDGENIHRALAARTMFENALRLFPAPASGFLPEVLNCSATENSGIAEIWEMINRYVRFTQQNGFFDENRSRQANHFMYNTINESLHNLFYQNERVQMLLKQYEKRIQNNEISSFVAAQEVLDKLSLDFKM
jgi:LAO/AO transport system kinase